MRGLPADIPALGGEGRRLVQHRIDRVLALRDFQHAAEDRAATGAVGAGLEFDREAVELLIRPFADLLVLAFGAEGGGDG